MNPVATPRVGDSLSGLDCAPVLPAELGEAVCPALGGPVRGRGVDNPNLIVRERDGLFCRRVGEAEKSYVAFIDELSALVGVLALILGDVEDFDLFMRRKTRPELKSGGALGAVYEYL